MIRVFCGYDPREAIGFHVFVHSLIKHASEPVSITPLAETGMPAGSNAFTFSRFLVPWLCNFEGWAIFLDGADMLMRDDIAKLYALRDPQYAVQVVKHADYRTRHPIKYRGTSMQCPNRDYARKNWASAMLINCDHPDWIGPADVQGRSQLDLLQFRFLSTIAIGELPARWNVLADEGQPIEDAAVLHWTAGIPAIPAYLNSPGADLWHVARCEMSEVP